MVLFKTAVLAVDFGIRVGNLMLETLTGLVNQLPDPESILYGRTPHYLHTH